MTTSALCHRRRRHPRACCRCRAAQWRRAVRCRRSGCRRGRVVHGREPEDLPGAASAGAVVGCSSLGAASFGVSMTTAPRAASGGRRVDRRPWRGRALGHQDDDGSGAFDRLWSGSRDATVRLAARADRLLRQQHPIRRRRRLGVVPIALPFSATVTSAPGSGAAGHDGAALRISRARCRSWVWSVVASVSPRARVLRRSRVAAGAAVRTVALAGRLMSRLGAGAGVGRGRISGGRRCSGGIGGVGCGGLRRVAMWGRSRRRRGGLSGGRRCGGLRRWRGRGRGTAAFAAASWRGSRGRRLDRLFRRWRHGRDSGGIAKPDAGADGSHRGDRHCRKLQCIIVPGRRAVVGHAAKLGPVAACRNCPVTHRYHGPDPRSMALRNVNRDLLLPMPVWDRATRLFHWLLVARGGDAPMAVRGRISRRCIAASGFAVLALLLFRVAWGFVGSDTARFRAVPDARRVPRCGSSRSCRSARPTARSATTPRAAG